jgi:Ca2+/H+ antiporter, TMEM165/GDT1 family
LEFSWKQSWYRQAWSLSEKWATRRSCWHSCSLPRSSDRCPSSWAFGAWIAAKLGPDLLRWVIGVSFIAMAAWILVPDKGDEEAAGGKQRFGAFGTTLLAFFLAEMGDKTQVATVALAARYHDLIPVVAGTTLGMMVADVPAVFLGDTIARKVSMPLVHGIAAAMFAALGVLTLLNVGRLF